MPRVRREAGILRSKALASLRRASDAFNSSNDDGRLTSVLLHLQHSFEMLLKAALIQKKQTVVVKKTGYSITFEKCVKLAQEHLGLDDSDAGVIRAIDALRDAEQHYHADVDESILYLYCRASIPIFDEILRSVFDQRLADILPARVLPLTTRPPEDLQLLIDRQYSQIYELLRPGRRHQAEGRAMARALLALGPDSDSNADYISEKDVSAAVRKIQSGVARKDVFPNLEGLAAEATDGAELLVKVKIVKNDPDAAAFRYAGKDEQATAIREVDSHKVYHWTKRKLAAKLGISAESCCALRWKYEIDSDDDLCRVFTHNSTKYTGYSDRAFVKLRSICAEVDVRAVLREYRAHRALQRA